MATACVIEVRGCLRATRKLLIFPLSARGTLLATMMVQDPAVMAERRGTRINRWLGFRPAVAGDWSESDRPLFGGYTAG